MDHSGSGYGLWFLVIINSAIFIIFAFSFYKPKTKLDWRSFGAFSSFIVALFTEMYGFPLTIYFLSGWLETKFPQINLFSHDSGHIWYTLLGFKGNPHLNPIHIASNIFIILGFVLLYKAWKILYKAQKEHKLADTGIYSKIRHPQYVAFAIIMFGFLLQWPTLVTLVMFPILLFIYWRLSKREEKNSIKEFGDAYVKYAARVPRFIPKFSNT